MGSGVVAGVEKAQKQVVCFRVSSRFDCQTSRGNRSPGLAAAELAISWSGRFLSENS